MILHPYAILRIQIEKSEKFFENQFSIWMDLILFLSTTESPGSSFERSLDPGSDPASIKISFLSNDLLTVNKTSFHL